MHYNSFLSYVCGKLYIYLKIIFMYFTYEINNIFLFLESDLIPGLGTFFACLFLRMEIGILIGIGLNLISILYHAARPKLSIKVNTVSARGYSFYTTLYNS